jgi:dienelactone hydrolase
VRGDATTGLRRWIGLLLGLALGLAACGGQNVANNATATPAAIRWSDTVAPQGVDVPGAQWLKIEGAGGMSKNVQIAAVLRPQGSGPFPLVVWLHGSSGASVRDVSAAARLASAGFVVVVGCWTFTPEEAFVTPDGVSLPRIPCVQNVASTDAAIHALVQVGQQLPAVRKGAIGLYGVSFGGPEAVRYKDDSTAIGAVVLDSSSFGPTKANAPVLMLGGTADTFVSAEAQQTYEQALRNSGATVESHYYEGGTHGVALGDFQEDAIKRMSEFYLRYLK